MPRFRFLHRVGVTFASRLAVILLSSIEAVVIARFLGPAGKGIVTLLLVFPGICALILGGGFATANTYLVSSKLSSVKVLARHSTSLTVGATILLVIALAILIPLGLLSTILTGASGVEIIVAVVATPLAIMNAFVCAILQGCSRIFESNIVLIIDAALECFLVVTLAITHTMTPLTVITMSTIAISISTLWGAFILKKDGAAFRPQIEPEATKLIVRYGAKSYLGNLVQYMNYRLDMFIVGAIKGASAVGFYAVAVRLGEALWFLPVAFSFVLFPEVSRLTLREAVRLTNRTVGMISIATGAGAVFLWILGPTIINAVFTPRFAPASEALRLLLPGLFLLAVMRPLSSTIAGRGKPGWNSIAAAVGLILTLVLDLALIPKHGINGAALASSIAYGASTLVTGYFYVRLCRDRNDEMARSK